MIYELPYSRTEEAIKLTTETNVGMMGIWVYKVTQTKVAPFITAIPYSDLTFTNLCPSATTEIDSAPMFHVSHPDGDNDPTNDFEFTIENCGDGLSNYRSIGFLFFGTYSIRTEGMFTSSSGNVDGKFPQMYGVNEQTVLYLVLDNVDILTKYTVFFSSCQQQANTTGRAMSALKQESSVQVSWNFTLQNLQYNLEQYSVSGNGKCRISHSQWNMP